MRFVPTLISASAVALAACAPATTTSVASAPQPVVAVIDTVSIQALVGRLDLERYKATIKGLTQFGDRRQGTERNRAAVDWIEAQLKSYGCTNTERDHLRLSAAAAADRAPRRRPRRPSTASRRRAGRRTAARHSRTRTGVNTDSLAQPDAKLRALNAQPTYAGPARRRSTARRSARRIRTRCTSSAGTWTASAGARRRTTTARARRS